MNRARYRQWMTNLFRYFKASPEIIRLAVMMYVRFSLSVCNVNHEVIGTWWNQFGPLFAADVLKKGSTIMHSTPQWRWYMDEVFGHIKPR